MGKPSRGTPKDMRLKTNRAAAGKSPGAAKKPFPGAAPPFKSKKK